MDKENEEPNVDQGVTKSLLENFDPLFHQLNKTIDIDNTRESLPSFVNHNDQAHDKKSEYLRTNTSQFERTQNSELSNEYYSCEDMEIKSPSITLLLDQYGREINEAKQKYISTPMSARVGRNSKENSDIDFSVMRKFAGSNNFDGPLYDSLIEQQSGLDCTYVVEKEVTSRNTELCQDNMKNYIRYINDPNQSYETSVRAQEQDQEKIHQASSTYKPCDLRTNNGLTEIIANSTLSGEVGNLHNNEMDEESEVISGVLASNMNTMTDIIVTDLENESRRVIVENVNKQIEDHKNLHPNNKEDRNTSNLVDSVTSTYKEMPGASKLENIRKVNDIKCLDEDSKTVLADTINIYRAVIEAYVSSKNGESDVLKDQVEKLKADLRGSHEDYVALENSFSELHNRYDKMRNINVHLKENEKKLSQVFEQQNNLIKIAEERITQLALEAEAKLREANEEYYLLKHKMESDLSILQTSLRLEQTKSSNLEQNLQQKIKENEELTAICDELLAHANVGK